MYFSLSVIFHNKKVKKKKKKSPQSMSEKGNDISNGKRKDNRSKVFLRELDRVLSRESVRRNGQR